MTPKALVLCGRVISLNGPMSSVRDFAAARTAGRKLVMVTAYDAWSAPLLADAPVDALLVGDSAMMVVHGEQDTLGATPSLMAMHTRAVARGAPGKLIVADMPFPEARKGVVAAVECATLLLRAGAQAVKIEGIRGQAGIVRHLVESGIPVMGHLGLTPQSVKTLGGFSVQGRTAAEAARIEAEAAAFEEAGAFALVLECVPARLAAKITAARSIPTIGIGAGPDCGGQVLVLQDFLGLNPDFQPRFVRRFADGAGVFRAGVAGFSRAVRSGKFPARRESFS